MQMGLKSFLIVTVAVAGFGAGSARATEWTLDSGHSDVGFTVKHMMVTDTRGAIDKAEAKITIDDKDLTKSKVEVTIDTASVNTKNQKRDDHLRGPEFFDAAKHPKMTFKSTKIEKGATANAFKVTGDLTIRGVTKPVVLDVELSDVWTDPKEWGGNSHRGAKVRGKINRNDFGLTWQTKLDKGGVVVGDDVNLVIDAELLMKK